MIMQEYKLNYNRAADIQRFFLLFRQMKTVIELGRLLLMVNYLLMGGGVNERCYGVPSTRSWSASPESQLNSLASSLNDLQFWVVGALQRETGKVW